MTWEEEEGDRLLRVEKDWVWDYLASIGYWPKRESGYFHSDIDHFVIYVPEENPEALCRLQGVRCGEPVGEDFEIPLSLERDLRTKKTLEALIAGGELPKRKISRTVSKATGPARWLG